MAPKTSPHSSQQRYAAMSGGSKIPTPSKTRPPLKAAVKKKPPRPPWSREVDITYSPHFPTRDSIHPALREESPETEVLDIDHAIKSAELGMAAVDATRKKAHRDYRNLESLTYASIVSIMDYNQKRVDPEDEVFQGIASGLRLRHVSHGKQKENSLLFNLPVSVRRLIWRHVFNDGGERDSGQQNEESIRLQPFSAYLKDVWQEENFWTPTELLEPARGAAWTSVSMRADVYAYILATYRFHFTLSPFVRMSFCPELFGWMETYSSFMRCMTVELDLSKLGFSPDAAAVALRPGSLHVETLMRRWVDVQLKGRQVPIRSLILLARRYHGMRLEALRMTDVSPMDRITYCPPMYDYTTASPITELKHQIELIQLAGFNSSSADHLLREISTHAYSHAKSESLGNWHQAGISKVWPFLEGQASIHRDAEFGKVHLSNSCNLDPITSPPSTKTTITKRTQAKAQAQSLRIISRNHEGFYGSIKNLLLRNDGCHTITAASASASVSVSCHAQRKLPNIKDLFEMPGPKHTVRYAGSSAGSRILSEGKGDEIPPVPSHLPAYQSGNENENENKRDSTQRKRTSRFKESGLDEAEREGLHRASKTTVGSDSATGEDGCGLRISKATTWSAETRVGSPDGGFDVASREKERGREKEKEKEGVSAKSGSQSRSLRAKKSLRSLLARNSGKG